jgi:hypothetical protein
LRYHLRGALQPCEDAYDAPRPHQVADLIQKWMTDRGLMQ